jgi:hypothetical protein
VLNTTIHKTKEEDKQTFVFCLVHDDLQHILCCIVCFVFLRLCLVYGVVQHILCCVCWFVCLRLLSCAWGLPTHIVCVCLSSSFVLCMVVFNTYCNNTICVGDHHAQDKRRRQTKQTTQHNMCWRSSCTRQKTKTSKTKNTTQYVLDTTVHTTKFVLNDTI